MGQKACACFLAGLVALCLVIPGCRKGREEGRTLEGRPPAAGKADLRVLSATPQGKTSSHKEAESVVVMFDRPMVALEALPEGKGKPLLKFEPAAA